MIDRQELERSLASLRIALNRYAEKSDLTEAEIIRKKTTQLAVELRRAFRALAPARGSIRAAQISNLGEGRGVHVRAAVYDRLTQTYGLHRTTSGSRVLVKGAKGSLTTKDGLNFQALAVKRELTLRETGIGFMAFSVPSARFSNDVEVATSTKTSRYGPRLSNFVLEVRQRAKTKSSLFTWPSSSSALIGLSKEQQYNNIVNSVRLVEADTLVYVERKIREDIESSGVA